MAGANDDDPNPNKVVFNIKDYLAKRLKYQCIGMNKKQKVRIKIQQMSMDIGKLQNQHRISLTFWSDLMREI